MAIPDESPLARARRRAGYAAIALVVLAVLSATQAGAIAGAAPVDLFGQAGAGDAASVTMASGLALIGATTVLALAAAWMVWRYRSRIAICAGLGIVALNCVEYALAMMAGQASLRGIVVTLVAGVVLAIALGAARDYHRMKDAAA